MHKEPTSWSELVVPLSIHFSVSQEAFEVVIQLSQHGYHDHKTLWEGGEGEVGGGGGWGERCIYSRYKVPNPHTHTLTSGPQ